MHFKILFAVYFNLDQSKILLSGNGLSKKKNAEVVLFDCISNPHAIVENLLPKFEYSNFYCLIS